MTTTIPDLPRCAGCGALPQVITGLPVLVTFTEDCATISVNLSELHEAADAGEWAFACTDGCEEVQGDTAAWTIASAALSEILGDVGRNCEPSLDYTIGSGANRG